VRAQLLGDLGGRARGRLAARQQRVELLGERGELRLRAVLAPQVHEARVPAPVGAAGDVERLVARRGDHYVARGAHERQPRRVAAPQRAVAVGRLAHHPGRRVAHDVHRVLRAPVDRRHVAHAVPQRRVRALHGLELDGHFFIRVEPALVRQSFRF
jgi:hypothetical protein